jgi:MOSC domain-containing protein YiiM
MKIISINTARVAPLSVTGFGTKEFVMSGIRKQAVTGVVQVKLSGIDGDEQADPSVHGGLDKAVYLYPNEHYAYWQQQRYEAIRDQQTIAPGMLGENLTTEGLLEKDLWVGDRLQISDVLLEVTEPREPCFKFAARMGYAQAVKQMLTSGYSGVYLKVIATGSIQAGSTITLMPGAREVSIAAINDRHRKARRS